jgi:hypothetical protein
MRFAMACLGAILNYFRSFSKAWFLIIIQALKLSKSIWISRNVVIHYIALTQSPRISTTPGYLPLDY